MRRTSTRARRGATRIACRRARRARAWRRGLPAGSVDHCVREHHAPRPRGTRRCRERPVDQQLVSRQSLVAVDFGRHGCLVPRIAPTRTWRRGCRRRAMGSWPKALRPNGGRNGTGPQDPVSGDARRRVLPQQEGADAASAAITAHAEQALELEHGARLATEGRIARAEKRLKQAEAEAAKAVKKLERAKSAKRGRRRRRAEKLGPCWPRPSLSCAAASRAPVTPAPKRSTRAGVPAVEAARRRRRPRPERASPRTRPSAS